MSQPSNKLLDIIPLDGYGVEGKLKTNMKLFKIKHSADSDWLYVTARTLTELVSYYPNAPVIEHVSDRVSVNTGDRYALLVKAYKFIMSGANTQTKEARLRLQADLEDMLDISDR